jgi:hypothetical protein
VQWCPTVHLRALPGAWAQSGLIFIHLRSGSRCLGDLCDEVESQALDAGYLIVVRRVDPAVSSEADLTERRHIAPLQTLKVRNFTHSITISFSNFQTSKFEHVAQIEV